MKNLIFKNFGLKIASILLAIILWIFASSRGQSEKYIDLPLEFGNMPSGLELVESSDKFISLHIKGPERTIKNIKAQDIRAYIDLGKAKKGESIYYVTRDNIQVPNSITILNISPSSIKIITEKTATKTVEVTPVLTGELDKGYKVHNITVVPENIEIEGIESEVSKIRKLKTESLDITGARKTFTQELKFDLKGNKVKAKPNSVLVTVIIGGHEER